MKCVRFGTWLLALLLLSSALSAEWCFEDEDYQALLDNRAEIAQELISQETLIDQQQQQLTIAQSWQEISSGAIQQLRDWYSEAQIYWRRQNIVTGVTAASCGIIAGYLVCFLIGTFQ